MTSRPCLAACRAARSAAAVLTLASFATPALAQSTTPAASTDSIGDGKIFVLDLASTTRIRTGETGDTAL